jgi:DNA-binding transcriptional ArsR family regulator
MQTVAKLEVPAHEGPALEGPARDDIDLVDVLQALGDPVRLQIVRTLDEADEPIACHELGLPVSKSTGSHHLKVLREAGVVTARVDGTRRYHTLRRDDLEARFPGLLDSVLPDGVRSPASLEPSSLRR